MNIPDVARPSAIRPVLNRVSRVKINWPGEVARHQHMNYEIIFVDKGLYACRHNDEYMELGENGLLIVKPGDWHNDLFAKKGLCYWAVGFSLQLARDVPISVFRDNTPVQRQHFMVRRGDFLPLFMQIDRESRIGDFASAHIQDALVLELFYRIIRIIPRDILADCFAVSSEESAFSANLSSMLNARLSQKLRVRELAAALGMSESSLAHKCRKLLHNSPSQLFMQIKMDRARQMLQSTDMSIKEVSAYLGFDDPAHFARTFKAKFQKSPSAIKRLPPHEPSL